MLLLVVRHADAGDAEEWARKGKRDSERPLSDKGRRQMLDVAPALQSLVPDVDRIISSPYLRAVQTAEYLQAEWEIEKLFQTETLEPDASPESFAEWLGRHPPSKVTAIAGHEPFLSSFATWLIAGTRDSRVRMRKAGSCLLRLQDVHAGEAELQWLMGPDQLAALGGTRG